MLLAIIETIAIKIAYNRTLAFVALIVTSALDLFTLVFQAISNCSRIVYLHHKSNNIVICPKQLFLLQGSVCIASLVIALVLQILHTSNSDLLSKPCQNACWHPWSAFKTLALIWSKHRMDCLRLKVRTMTIKTIGTMRKNWISCKDYCWLLGMALSSGEKRCNEVVWESAKFWELQLKIL